VLSIPCGQHLLDEIVDIFLRGKTHCSSTGNVFNPATANTHPWLCCTAEAQQEGPARGQVFPGKEIIALRLIAFHH
jgi:hypothetical protein